MPFQCDKLPSNDSPVCDRLPSEEAVFSQSYPCLLTLFYLV
nr:hypothetical protein [Escherichia coli]